MGFILTVAALVAAGSGTVSFLVLRRDLSRRWAIGAAVGCALVVTLGFLVTLYLAVAAFLGAVAAYLVIRRFVPFRAALLLGAGSYVALSAASLVVLSMALDSM